MSFCLHVCVYVFVSSQLADVVVAVVTFAVAVVAPLDETFNSVQSNSSVNTLALNSIYPGYWLAVFGRHCLNPVNALKKMNKKVVQFSMVIAMRSNSNVEDKIIVSLI